MKHLYAGVLVLGLAGQVYAGRGENSGTPQALDSAVLTDPAPDPTVADAELWRWTHQHLSVAAGPAFFLGGHGSTITSTSLNVRVRLGKAEQTDAPWLLEVGGNLPRSVDDPNHSVQEVLNGTGYTASVRSVAEAHIAAHYELPHGRQDILVPEMGFGVSAMQIQDQIDVVFPSGFALPPATITESKTSFSPLLELGLRFFSEHRVSLGFDAAYVSYANIPSSGADFNLSLTGWMLRAVLQVKL